MFNKFKRKIEHAQHFADVSKMITPALIEEKPDHILIDMKTHVKCLVIGLPHMTTEGYPSNMSPFVIDRLLDLSAEGCTISYSYTLIPIPPIEATAMLEHAEFVNVGNQKITQDNNPLGLVPMNLQLDHEDLRNNYAELHRHEQNMFHSAFIITMWARSEADMRRVSSHVEAILEAERILYEYPFYQMLNTFIAAQPYPITADYTWVECFSEHAAKLAATRNPNSRMDDHGLYFGVDIKTGKTVQVDLKLLAAQHLMFVGPTGSGKTFTLLMLLMRAHDMLGKRIIYSTPKADVSTNYRAVAEYYGKTASIIDVGPRGHNINPLQILYDKNQMAEGAWAYTRAYDYHKDILAQFFATWFEGTMTRNMDSYLDDTLNRVYRSAGIYRENPESWDTAQWPNMEDLREVWESDMNNKKTGTRQMTAEALWNKTYRLGSQGSLAYMNRPTDIDLSADFIVIDFSDVPETVQDAMNVLVTGIMGMRFSTDATKETIIAIDEAAVFLRNPSLSTFLLKTLTQGRSYNIALWMATQQTVDLMKAGVNEEFKTNMQVNIVLGDNMRKDTIEHVKEFFRLDESAQESLMSCSVGEGLLIVGDETIPTRFKPTAHEMAVIKGEINVQKTSTDGDLKVDKTVVNIAAEHGIYLEEWVENSHVLQQMGYESKMLQRAAGRGTVRAWIDSALIKDGKIGNQSIDHYGAVIQMAGYLAQNKFEIKINHYNDADIIASRDGKTVAFEYERPGSHNSQELIEKKQRAENTHGQCFFVCTAENEKKLKSVVGAGSVIRRGTQFVDFVQTLIGDGL